jgi:hypothetical protein
MQAGGFSLTTFRRSALNCITPQAIRERHCTMVLALREPTSKPRFLRTGRGANLREISPPHTRSSRSVARPSQGFPNGLQTIPCPIASEMTLSLRSITTRALSSAMPARRERDFRSLMDDVRHRCLSGPSTVCRVTAAPVQCSNYNEMSVDAMRRPIPSSNSYAGTHVI